jgi:hypothetical protein
VGERELGGVSGIATEIAALGHIAVFPIAGPSSPRGSLYITAHAGYGSFEKLLPKDQGKRQLTLTLWRIDTSKTTIVFDKRASVTRKGNFRKLALAFRGHGNSIPQTFVLAAQDGSDNLRVMVWEAA